MSFWDDLFGGGDDEVSTTTQTPVFTPGPELPEAKGARETWWNTLQADKASGSYGANLPNYEAIKQNALNKINQYYWGGANTPGLIDKLRASAARRGVSDSPALDVMTGRMGAEQAGQIRDTSVGVDTTKANAVEQARQNWLNSITNLSQMKPFGTWGGTTTVSKPNEGLLPSLISGGVELAGNYMMGNKLSAMNKQNQAAMNKQNQDWWSSMYGKTPDTISSGNVGMSSDGGWDWGDAAKLGMEVLPFLL
jgi:hypothetical protein